jgi:hypothetical protein
VERAEWFCGWNQIAVGIEQETCRIFQPADAVVESLPSSHSPAYFSQLLTDTAAAVVLRVCVGGGGKGPVTAHWKELSCPSLELKLVIIMIFPLPLPLPLAGVLFLHSALIITAQCALRV